MESVKLKLWCHMDNRIIARRLLEYAHGLEEREDNIYRVRAYRVAAQTILALERPLAAIVAAEGRKGLEALPGIGRHLSYTLNCLVTTGEFRTLDNEGKETDDDGFPTNHPGTAPQYTGQPALPFEAGLSDAGAHGS
jgi:DNA polymerase/3'-5' exonuclease PolX